MHDFQILAKANHVETPSFLTAPPLVLIDDIHFQLTDPKILVKRLRR